MCRYNAHNPSRRRGTHPGSPKGACRCRWLAVHATQSPVTPGNLDQNAVPDKLQHRFEQKLIDILDQRDGTKDGLVACGGSGALERQRKDRHCRCDPEPGGDEAANVVDGHIGEYIVLQSDGGDLHTGVDCGTNGTTQRIPDKVVEPGAEGLPSVLVQVLRSAVVEVRIKLVNDASVFVNGVQSNRVGFHERSVEYLKDSRED
mmetsp:Transcript_70440/g.187596  ORF Transcript_70440/g.187596 Transcript_70440/m.187596 type:complete len:203 (+) Transcript_70440:279-887(+)